MVKLTRLYTSTSVFMYW